MSGQDAAGREVWGRYTVYDEIATGGMAVVYLATSDGSGNLPPVVAIKRLLTQHAKDLDFVRMFVEEARVAMRVRHRNVVTTHECIEVPGSLGLVMDYVAGDPLSEMWRVRAMREEEIPLPVIGKILIGALRGLNGAHEARDVDGQNLGVIHRDISPHNIIVGLDGVTRVIDFGIARAAGRMQNTQSGVVKGKFAYMSPEQLSAVPLTSRSDIYGMGAVLWELLTGQRLFSSSSNHELIVLRARGVLPPPPSSVVAGLPAHVDELVTRALAPRPEDRFATAAEMAEAVREVLGEASESEVAQWVTRLASPGLLDRERKRVLLERSVNGSGVERVGGGGPASGEQFASRDPSRRTSGRPGSAPRVAHHDAPTQVERRTPPPDSVLPKKRQTSPPGSVRAKPPRREASAPEVARSDRRSSSPTPSDRAPQGSAPPAAPAPASNASPAPAVRAPSTRPPAPRPEPDRASGAPRSGSSPIASVPSSPHHESVWPDWARGVALVLALGLLAGGGMEGTKAWAKAGAIAAAAQRGVTLTVDSVTLSFSGATLHGLKANLVDHPELAFVAPEASFVDDAHGSRLVVPSFEATLHGTTSEVASNVAAWRAKAQGPFRAEARGGHVTWTGLVNHASLESPDVKVELGPVDGGHGEDGVHATLHQVVVHLPKVTLGPWQAEVNSDASKVEVDVSLQPTTRDKPEVVIARRDAGTTFDVDLPPSSPVSFGFPAGLIDLAPDKRIALSLHGLVPPSGHAVDARWKLAIADDAPLITSEGKISGDPAGPLVVQHPTMSVGTLPREVHAQVRLDTDALRVTVEEDVPATQKRAAASWVFDTHAWTAP
jgi:serine/threonine-protein kinase